MDLQIRIDPLTGPEVAALLREHLDEMQRISPPESVHALDLAKLRQADVTFWSAWSDGGQASSPQSLRNDAAFSGASRIATGFCQAGYATVVPAARNAVSARRREATAARGRRRARGRIARPYDPPPAPARHDHADEVQRVLATLAERSTELEAAGLRLQEMGSRYLYIVLMVLLEHRLSRGDYRRHDLPARRHRWTRRLSGPDVVSSPREQGRP